jgi:hypothetical protein
MKLLLLALLVTQTPFGGERPVAPGRARRQDAPAPVLRPVIYDVQDLVLRDVVEFEPVTLGIEQPKRAPATKPGVESTEQSARARRSAAGRALQLAVHKYMTPKLEEPRDHVTYREDLEGVLQTNLGPEQHAWMQCFLEAQRRFEGFVQLDARVYELESGELKKIGIESSAVVSKGESRDALFAKLATVRNSSVMMIPRVLAAPNQRSNVSTINQVAYIKSFTVEVVEPGQREIADPEVAVINEGLVLDVRATPIDEGILALELALDCAEVVRPIKTRKVRLSTAAPSEGEIGVPEVLSSRIVATVTVREGSSVVLSTPRQGDKTGELVLVLTAERVPMPPAPPKTK